MKWYFPALVLREVYISNYPHLRKEITGRAAAAAAAATGIFIYFPSCVLQRCGKRDRARQRSLIYDGLMVVWAAYERKVRESTANTFDYPLMWCMFWSSLDGVWRKGFKENQDTGNNNCPWGTSLDRKRINSADLKKGERTRKREYNIITARVNVHVFGCVSKPSVLST